MVLNSVADVLLVSVWCLFLDGTMQTSPISADYIDYVASP
jgi:hypothetical protein